MCPLRLRWTMVTSWSWMVQRNRSMHIARCLGCRVLGLTLHIVGSHNTLRPVHLQAWWVAFSLRVCKVWPSPVPEQGKINGSFLWFRSSFCHSLFFSIWLALGFVKGGGLVTVVGVHPTWRCTSPGGVLPVGLGEGVGLCHDVANLPRVCLFISPLVFWWRKLCSF